MSEDYDRRLRRAMELGQDARAMRLLLEMLADFPDNEGSTRALMAVAHHKADRIEQAVVEARRAIALIPQTAPTYVILGNALLQQGDTAGAERACRDCLALDPTNAAAHATLARILASEERGREEEALAHAREAVRLEPDKADHHVMVAAILIQRDPSTAEAAAGLAVLLLGTALLTAGGVYKRARPLRDTLPQRGRWILRSFLHRRRAYVVWAAILAVIWVALVIGVVSLIAGSAAPLGWTLVGGAILMVAGYRIATKEFAR